MSTMAHTQADFAALRSRLDRVSDRIPLTPPQTVATLVAAELDRRAQAERDREHAATLAKLRGGPCVYCGQTVSGVWQDFAGEHGNAAVRRELIPSWTATPLGPSCFECSQDAWAAGGAHSHKGHVARELLACAGKAGHWTAAHLGDRLRQAGTPVYWCEHTPRPATRTTEGPLTQRFAFVSVAAILDALPKPPPPPSFRTGRPCATCGAPDRWVYIPASTTTLRPAQVDLSLDLLAPLRAQAAPPADAALSAALGLAEVPVSEAWRCWACGDYGRP